jgi:hypothetical protein
MLNGNRGRRWRRALKAMGLVMALGVSTGVEAAERDLRTASGWESWRGWLAGLVLEFAFHEVGLGIDPNGGAAPPAAEPDGSAPESESREAGLGIDPGGRPLLVSPQPAAETGVDGGG